MISSSVMESKNESQRSDSSYTHGGLGELWWTQYKHRWMIVFGLNLWASRNRKLKNKLQASNCSKYEHTVFKGEQRKAWKLLFYSHSRLWLPGDWSMEPLPPFRPHIPEGFSSPLRQNIVSIYWGQSCSAGKCYQNKYKRNCLVATGSYNINWSGTKVF